MHVVFLIGVQVVDAMMRGPPQGSLLGGRVSQQRENKLEPPRRLVGAMGEVAMIETGDREHPQPKRGECDAKRDGTPTDPDDAEDHEVDAQERQSVQPRDAVTAGRKPADLGALTY